MKFCFWHEKKSKEFEYLDIQTLLNFFFMPIFLDIPTLFMLMIKDLSRIWVIPQCLSAESNLGPAGADCDLNPFLRGNPCPAVGSAMGY